MKKNSHKSLTNKLFQKSLTKNMLTSDKLDGCGWGEMGGMAVVVDGPRSFFK